MNSSNNIPPISPERLAEDFFSMEETAIAEVLADYAAGLLSEDEASEAKDLIENHPIAIGLWQRMEANRREDETPEGQARLNAITQKVLARLDEFKKSQSPPALVALPTAARSESGNPSLAPRQPQLLTCWSSGFTEGIRTSAMKAAAATAATSTEVETLWELSDEDGKRRILRHPNGRLFLQILTRDESIASKGVTIRLVEPAPVIRFESHAPGLYGGKAQIPSDFASKVISGEKEIELELANVFESGSSNE